MLFRSGSLNEWLNSILKRLQVEGVKLGENPHFVELFRNTAIFDLLNAGANTWLIAQISGVGVENLAKHYEDVKWDLSEKLDEELRKGPPYYDAILKRK